MRLLANSVLVHRFALVLVAGVAFLAAVMGLGPSRTPFAGLALVQAAAPLQPGFPRGGAAGATVTVRPGTHPGLWEVEVRAQSQPQAAAGLEETLEAWAAEVRRVAGRDPALDALRAALGEKQAAQARRQAERDQARRRLEALDAVTLAMGARLDALRGLTAPARETPGTGALGQWLGTLRAQRGALQAVLPADHPDLLALSREVRRFELASADRASRAAAERLALLSLQRRRLLDRLPGDHPDVHMKEAEIREAERGFAAAIDLAPEPAASGGSSETPYLAVELRVLALLEQERQRVRATPLSDGVLEVEAADLAGEIARLEEAADRRSRFEVLSGPTVERRSEVTGRWLAAALTTAFLAGLVTALVLHGARSRIWSEADLPPGAEAVFAAPAVPSRRSYARAVLQGALALGPWVLALALLT